MKDMSPWLLPIGVAIAWNILNEQDAWLCSRARRHLLVAWTMYLYFGYHLFRRQHELPQE